MSEFIVSNNTDLFVTGEIGYDFQADYFMQQLNSFDKEDIINVHIYSGGGSLFDALAVYDFVKLKGIKFNAYVSGLSGSAATIIGASAENTYIGANSMYFIHNAITENESLMKLGTERIISIYQKLTGLSKPRLKQLLSNGDSGAFLSSKEAIELGFVNSEFKEDALAASMDFHKEYVNKINNNMTDENLNELKSGIVTEVVNSVKDFFNKKEKDVSNSELDESVKNEVSNRVDDVVNSYEAKIKESNEAKEAREVEVEAEKLELQNSIDELNTKISALEGKEVVVAKVDDPSPIVDEKVERSEGENILSNILNSATPVDKFKADVK